MPPGCSLVIRALPAAATATSKELGTDLDAALKRLGLSEPQFETGSPEQTRPSGAHNDGSTV
jgi:ribonuclease P protein component